MTGPWPFAGREAQFDAVLGAVAEQGVILAGPAGVGKSRLAAEVTRPMKGRVRVSATAAAADIPLGAFSHVLPADPPSGNVIRWAAGALHRDGLVLVVDDAHLLDPVSAALVHHLVGSGGARVLATIRSGARAPDAVTALWKDELLPRLELRPLDLEGVTQVLGGALGGTVESTTALRLQQISGGNVLFLRELVLAGKASGALRERDGRTWIWEGELSVSTRLQELIESRIGDIAPDERAALEYIAYGEPLSADLLARLAPPQVIERLERRELITVGEDYSVGLAHPLYGEVIRAGCGRLRTRAVLGELADAVSARGLADREDKMRVAVWRLDSGQADDPVLLASAGQAARQVRDLKLAARLARAAVAAGGGPEASILLASVLNHDDLFDEADEVMAGIDPAAMTQEQRAICAVSRTLIQFYRHGSADGARAVLADGLPTLTEPEPRAGLLSLWAAVESNLGDFDRAREIIQQTRAEGVQQLYLEIGAQAAEALMLAHEGRSFACEDLVSGGLAEIDAYAEGLPTLRSALHDAGSLAAVYAGDLRRAQEHAEGGYRMGQNFGGWNRAIIPFGGRRAEVHRLRGELHVAIRLCRQVAVRLPAHPSVYAGPCLGELAHALALTGDVAGAREALQAAGEQTLVIGINVDPPIKAAERWLLAAQGNVAGAVASALEHADATRGLFPYELTALHDVVRLGRPELVADRLAEIAARTDGALAPLLARHARAGADPAELSTVSKAFESLGFPVHAAEAAAQAAAGYRDHGLKRPFQAEQLRAWNLARRCDGVRTPALTGLAVPDLTPRQREIAQLAAAGLSNRQIAEQLVLSVRTVANTLGATYEKLGVNDRVGLSRILGDLG